MKNKQNKKLYDFLQKFMLDNNIDKLNVNSSLSITNKTLNMITDYNKINDI